MQEKLHKIKCKELQEKRELTKQKYISEQKSEELELRRKYKELQQKDMEMKQKREQLAKEQQDRLQELDQQRSAEKIRKKELEYKIAMVSMFFHFDFLQESATEVEGQLKEIQKRIRQVEDNRNRQNQRVAEEAAVHT